jgi:hypothetical protein
MVKMKTLLYTYVSGGVAVPPLRNFIQLVVHSPYTCANKVAVTNTEQKHYRDRGERARKEKSSKGGSSPQSHNLRMGTQ